MCARELVSHYFLTTVANAGRHAVVLRLRFRELNHNHFPKAEFLLLPPWLPRRMSSSRWPVPSRRYSHEAFYKTFDDVLPLRQSTPLKINASLVSVIVFHDLMLLSIPCSTLLLLLLRSRGRVRSNVGGWLNSTLIDHLAQPKCA